MKTFTSETLTALLIGILMLIGGLFWIGRTLEKIEKRQQNEIKTETNKVSLVFDDNTALDFLAGEEIIPAIYDQYCSNPPDTILVKCNGYKYLLTKQ